MVSVARCYDLAGVAGFHPGYRCREVLEDEIGIMTGLDGKIF